MEKNPVDEGRRYVSDGADTRHTGAEEGGEGRDGVEAELRGRLPSVVRRMT